MRYDVKLVHGTYETTVSVHADDEEEAIAKAKARARRDGFYHAYSVNTPNVT